MRVCLVTACFGYKAKMKSTRAIPTQIRMSACKKTRNVPIERDKHLFQIIQTRRFNVGKFDVAKKKSIKAIPIVC